jgi:uncharacterized membrane protein
MDIGRIARHLFAGPRSVARAFPPKSFDAIERAIAEGETAHLGEIRFVVEASLDNEPLFAGLTPRERALDVFSLQRVWDTEHNSGVLIYVLLADRDVEIVADRGAAARVGESEWLAVCHEMEAAFRRGDFEAGAVAGVRAVSSLLQRHLPAHGANPDELANRPGVV